MKSVIYIDYMMGSLHHKCVEDSYHPLCVRTHRAGVIELEEAMDPFRVADLSRECEGQLARVRAGYSIKLVTPLESHGQLTKDAHLAMSEIKAALEGTPSTECARAHSQG